MNVAKEIDDILDELAGQQAMPDDWWKPKWEAIKAKLVPDMAVCLTHGEMLDVGETKCWSSSPHCDVRQMMEVDG